jgi:hypothetical protein
VFTFIETRLFAGLREDHLSDDELTRLQQYLIDNPEQGDVIPGSGSVRKIRWGVAGRGGLRIISFLRSAQGQFWLLTLYAKNVSENIPGHILRKIKDEIDGKS